MNQLPAHLAARNRPAMLQEAMAGLNRSRGPHVSIADNRFTLVDGSGNEKPIQTLYVDLVVVDVNPHVSRLYYDPTKPYNKDDNTVPLCFSDNGIGASAQASQPQNTNCQLCPKAAWNSAVSKMTGKGVPACAQRKKLAVVAGGTGEMVFDLTVPPASLGNWLAYCNILAQRGLEPYDVFTRVEFASQGVLQFSPAPIGDKGLCYVPPEIVELTEKLWAAKATADATNKNDVPWGGQADAQKIAYAQQQAPAIATPVALPAPAFMPPPQPFGTTPTTMPPPGHQFMGSAPVNPQPFVGSQGVAQQANPFGQGQVGEQHPNPFSQGQAGTSSPPDMTPVKRGRGPNKPKAEAAAPADEGIPPFLRRDPPPVAAPAPNPTQFGMQAAPPAPDAGIQAALDAAFSLPT